MALKVHFDLGLCHIKIVFLNGNLYNEVYMQQSKDFMATKKEQMVCKLKKSIYDLK